MKIATANSLIQTHGAEGTSNPIDVPFSNGPWTTTNIFLNISATAALFNATTTATNVSLHASSLHASPPA
uniref:Candidate secreted effector n=1 Tax=Meloidogyne incognita TaxID=6306 RepID=A0A914LWR4_MELIC